MAESDTLDYTDAQAIVAKARDELAAGHDKQAAEVLTHAAYHTRDAEIERQVREVAAEGLARTGRLGRGRWKEIIRTVDSLQAFRTNRDSPTSAA
jgi:hypothetical protein